MVAGGVVAASERRDERQPVFGRVSGLESKGTLYAR